MISTPVLFCLFLMIVYDTAFFFLYFKFNYWTNVYNGF